MEYSSYMITLSCVTVPVLFPNSAFLSSHVHILGNHAKVWAILGSPLLSTCFARRSPNTDGTPMIKNWLFVFLTVLQGSSHNSSFKCDKYIMMERYKREILGLASVDCGVQERLLEQDSPYCVVSTDYKNGTSNPIHVGMCHSFHTDGSRFPVALNVGWSWDLH